MTDLNRVDSSNISGFVATTGTPVTASRDGTPSTWGCTLASSTVYYFPVGASKSAVPAEAPYVSIHLRGDAAIIATITVEDCNYPSTTSPGDNRGVADVSDFDTTAGYWVQENPSTAIVGVNGTGWSAVAATVSVAGGNAGGCMFHVGNLGSRRMRLKVAVGGTGGKVRVAVHGKGP